MSGRYECEECEWTGDSDDLDPIDDVEQRVATGEIMAAGQCPDCAALIGAQDEDIPDYTIERVIDLARRRGFLPKESP